MTKKQLQQMQKKIEVKKKIFDKKANLYADCWEKLPQEIFSFVDELIAENKVLSKEVERFISRAF